MFRGIDTSDPAQVEGIAECSTWKIIPDSSADLGIDDRAVVSSILAEQFAIQVGDTIRLYSTRNFEEVMRAYKATEKPPLREAFAADWKQATAALAAAWKADGRPRHHRHRQPAPDLSAAGSICVPKTSATPNGTCSKRCSSRWNSGDKDEAAGVYRFDAETKAAIGKAIAELNATDPEKMDGETLKGLKNIVLPKEAKVIGVYQASQMAVTPDLFVPLPLAQDLAGLG